MQSWLIAVIIRPLALLLLFLLVVRPLKLAFVRWFPEGRTKDFLLR
jgi:hypothetical protein